MFFDGIRQFAGRKAHSRDVEVRIMLEFVKICEQVEFILLNKRNAKTTAERFEVAAAYCRITEQLLLVQKELAEIQEAIDAVNEILESC